MQQRAQELLVGLFERAVEHDQQIDVRVETEVPAAVATKRRDRHASAGRRRIGDELRDERVEPRRVALERDASALAAKDVVAELPPRRLEQDGGSRLRPKSAHRPHTLHCDGHPGYLPLKLKEYSIPNPTECWESLNAPSPFLKTSWSEK